MRIGFHLRYKDTDHGRAATRLAEFARSRGHDVAFHTTARHVPTLNPTWDRLVETEADRPYLSWVKDVDVLVCLEPVSAAHFSGAAKHGAKIVVLASWDTVREDLKECYQMADMVVCPSGQGTALLRESLGLKNCAHIPWDNGLPATRKAGRIDPQRVKVLFPMHGWQGGVTSPDVLNVVWRTLHKCPFADATLLYNPKSFNTAAHKGIKRIARTFGASGQFRAVPERDLAPGDALAHYARHDLVAWAAEQEGLAMVGLDALAMGTPVLAYDVAPQNEFLHDGKNAVLVPCELKYNWLGAPWAQSDTEAFETHLTGLLEDDAALSALRRFTRYGMAARRERFAMGWAQALSVR